MKKKLSKRFKKLIDITKKREVESIENAIKKVKANCTVKFDESIDVSLKLNLKQKKEEFTLRTIVNLPNGNGKKIKIAVLCEENKIQEAKTAGADISGSESLISDITSGKINFNKIIATPAMMPKMGKLGKILGPKGLMGKPVPVVITVYKDKKFDFVIKSPPASHFIKEAAKLKGGSKEPGRVIVGSITKKQAEMIAEEKMKDLNAHDLDEAVKIISGSARSMGIEVKE